MSQVPRPRCNRLTPFGTIEASLHRGTFLANRGDLDARDGTICRLWHRPAWLTCTLAEVFGRRVTFDRPGSYTPLFAYDEAVALAAGHRPCAACRRGAFNRFVSCWKAAHDISPDSFISARDIDRALHQARLFRGHQVRHKARVSDLPDGTFVLPSENPGQPSLLWHGYAHPWSHAGYGEPERIEPSQTVTVLTPIATVRVLVAEYRPLIALGRPQQSSRDRQAPL